MLWRLIALTWFLAFLFLAARASASVQYLYVSPTGDNTNNGTIDFPLKDISFAVNIAADGDTILLLNGTFTDPSTITVNKSLSFVTASGLPDAVVTRSSSGPVVIFVLTNLAQPSFKGIGLDGAGITSGSSCVTVAANVNATFTRVSFLNCISTAGGAIFNNGNVTVIDSTFTSNTAYYGGAIYNDFGTATVSNSSFTSNTASSDGGAIFNYGTATVIDCTFTSNTAPRYGGAILNYGTATVSNDTFTSNKANFGGAIYNYYDTATVSRSTFTSNTASYGGGVYVAAGITNFTNCNIEMNHAAGNGGGAYFAGGSNNWTSVIFECNTADVGDDNFNLANFDCPTCTTIACPTSTYTSTRTTSTTSTIPSTTSTMTLTTTQSSSSSRSTALTTTFVDTTTVVDRTTTTDATTRTSKTNDSNDDLWALFALFIIPIVIILGCLIWFFFFRKSRG